MITIREKLLAAGLAGVPMNIDYANRCLVPDEANAAIAAIAETHEWDFEIATTARLEAVNAKRDQITAGGYRHNFGATAGIRRLDLRGASDETAWLTVKMMAMDLVSANAGDTPIYIRDAANATFATSATVADTAMSAMGAWQARVRGRSWALKDAIDAATTQAELDAIDIDAGWSE